MKKLSLTIVAILMLQQAALAQGARGMINDGVKPQRQEDMTDMRAEWVSPSRSLVGKPHSCTPDQAETIWGPNNVLLGYKCVPPSANGG